MIKKIGLEELHNFLIELRENNYDRRQAIIFANNFFKDEDEKVEYSEDFIDRASDLMLYFDVHSLDSFDTFKFIINDVIQLFQAYGTNITRTHILEILNKHFDEKWE